MCGIAGILGPAASDDLLTRMLGRIAHRGEPSYQGERLVREGVMALGTNRLAIVDETGGRQPFVSLDEQVACVVNGEIYNHAELRAGLETATSCDTEVVLAGYRRWGAGVLPRLRGMFAIALYDARTGSVLLARDPMGIKPLYMAKLGDSLCFASELKAFADIGEIARVSELAPGCWSAGDEPTQYWSLPPLGQEGELSFGQLAHELRAAVAGHLPPPGQPVACLLSGGVDSSTVLALCHQLRPGQVEAWTFSRGDPDTADLAAARLVTRWLDVPLRIVQPQPAELAKLYLDCGVWLTETWEPALVRNAVSYHVLCAGVQRAGFKHCLSGEGADELFGGYDYFRLFTDAERDAAVHSLLAQIYRTYLQMADRASMFATLEVRVPYMDREVVRVAAPMPTAARFRNDLNKVALRELYPELLPESIRMRPKAGMNAGAGFGSNDPGAGFYYQAVCERYRADPDRLSACLKLTFTCPDCPAMLLVWPWSWRLMSGCWQRSSR